MYNKPDIKEQTTGTKPDVERKRSWKGFVWNVFPYCVMVLASVYACVGIWRFVHQLTLSSNLWEASATQSSPGNDHGLMIQPNDLKQETSGWHFNLPFASCSGKMMSHEQWKQYWIVFPETTTFPALSTAISDEERHLIELLHLLRCTTRTENGEMEYHYTYSDASYHIRAITRLSPAGEDEIMKERLCFGELAFPVRKDSWSVLKLTPRDSEVATASHSTSIRWSPIVLPEFVVPIGVYLNENGIPLFSMARFSSSTLSVSLENHLCEFWALNGWYSPCFLLPCREEFFQCSKDGQIVHVQFIHAGSQNVFVIMFDVSAL